MGSAPSSPPPRSTTFTLNGRTVVAPVGEMLAAALLALGETTLRYSPRRELPRGAFCFMGVCQECLVRVDGRLVQSCIVQVAPGIRVETEGRR